MSAEFDTAAEAKHSAVVTGQLVLGSRGSELALAQTALVERALRSVYTRLELVIQVVRTRGDEDSRSPVEDVHLDARAGRKGLFTGEIERELLAGRIDVAVHSAKDLPSELSAGTELVAALPRASTQDVFVSRSPGGFESLPRGARLGTASVRRRHQAQAVRPDLQIADLRGNVPTRLQKLATGDWAGGILARAGLERLGFFAEGAAIEFRGTRLWTTPLPTEQFLPAGGQGIIVLQVRADDDRMRLASAITDASTLICLRAEREFLRLLHGDCGSPVGVLATREGDRLIVRGEIFEPGAACPRRARVEGLSVDPAEAGRRLFEEIYGKSE